MRWWSSSIRYQSRPTSDLVLSGNSPRRATVLPGAVCPWAYPTARSLTLANRPGSPAKPVLICSMVSGSVARTIRRYGAHQRPLELWTCAYGAFCPRRAGGGATARAGPRPERNSGRFLVGMRREEGALQPDNFGCWKARVESVTKQSARGLQESVVESPMSGALWCTYHPSTGGGDRWSE